MVIYMSKIRHPNSHLIFNMGISIPSKTVFLIEMGPLYSHASRCDMTYIVPMHRDKPNITYSGSHRYHRVLISNPKSVFIFLAFGLPSYHGMMSDTTKRRQWHRRGALLFFMVIQGCQHVRFCCIQYNIWVLIQQYTQSARKYTQCELCISWNCLLQINLLHCKCKHIHWIDDNCDLNKDYFDWN